MTDHKPLTGLFSPKGIPETVNGRLQRWAVFRSYCGYEIRHVKGVHHVPAGFMSRFPVKCEDDEKDESSVSFLNFIEGEARSSVERKQLNVESRQDKLLGRVVEFMQSGWPRNMQEEEFKTFYQSVKNSTLKKLCYYGYTASLFPRN